MAQERISPFVLNKKKNEKRKEEVCMGFHTQGGRRKQYSMSEPNKSPAPQDFSNGFEWVWEQIDTNKWLMVKVPLPKKKTKKVK